MADPTWPPATPGRSRLPWVLGTVLVLALVAGGVFVGMRTMGGTDPAATASPSPSPSPASTLSAQEQQAVEEASAVVLAYDQMFVDIWADPIKDLNDLYDVATAPQIDLDLKSVQQQRFAGTITVDSRGPVVLGAVDPLEFALDDAPPSVTLLVCLDGTATSGTENGAPWTGRRQLAQYRVVKTDYLPAPGWAVAKVLPPPGFEQPQPC